ncbi:MAG: hypothetical protein UV61_C0008G0127 [Candidatus Gottesmanbacteria bacterium GW2011_GWB1_43_11]|uniref:Uncharacterized protein n=1 Tax=Candidatus Gottesmanbacteria bacterium GW2011_GWB1_43_11 TaxID=1618446 RepID=A0A0G1CMD8_9BACT|nr:MAG: hypothetical protein UV04_C0009G0040 [Candidatus Gottesmanbacteria bacterium GW2011_GWA2_42_16]KKS54969.1 MAG: hypothetical protein UV17_C0014G0052 [Candidatus Gottesmanbacteria bacterium GW2011_GWA1_42_26]KKS80464.1 MAG: hypothetical protein UV55_C0038G0011 [Candidatus Gottesmanbacteria bacterium GW2011_GWC1_43_10]KKS86674.1 MAG: hypothetical protein UV61_C0008G0127 [Candidatus Gottesmanbacteria bacterium GW2011_GWB1_43_11]OGG10542.1 MAG: hypothetical protein A2699_06270 [Candidatus Go
MVENQLDLGKCADAINNGMGMADGIFSLLTDRGTKVIARKPNGEPIYRMGGGCGTLVLSETDARAGFILSESIPIHDTDGKNPRINYPKSSTLHTGAKRYISVVEWFEEGDEVSPGVVHDHLGPIIVETPKGTEVRARKTA